MDVFKSQNEQIYNDFHDKVYGYIVSKINHKQNAEDLTSEVFVKVYEKLDSFDKSKASLSTWIYTITRNTLIDYYRTRKVLGEIPDELESLTTVEDNVINEEMLETFANALESLDERERDIIVLRYYSGKTLKEIAEGLQISYAYVKILQNKAFEQLRKYFND